MTMGNGHDTTEHTVQRGRPPAESREVWANRVQRWAESGLTSVDFAKLEGCPAASLSQWKWRLKKEANADPNAVPAPRQKKKPVEEPEEVVAEETTHEPAEEACLEIHLSDCVVRVPVGFDEYTLRRVLRLMRSQDDDQE